MSARGRKRKDGKAAPKPEHEFYPTPPTAIHPFLDEVWLPRGLWLEPAAGDGAIIRAVQSRRDDVTWHAVEIRKKASSLLQLLPVKGLWICDFLNWSPPPDVIYDVGITNPPFTLTMQFIERMRLFCRWLVILQRVGLAETEERAAFMRQWPPDANILPNRPSFTGHGTDGTTYCWWVWPPGDARPFGSFRVLRPKHKVKGDVGTDPSAAVPRRAFDEQLTEVPVARTNNAVGRGVINEAERSRGASLSERSSEADRQTESSGRADRREARGVGADGVAVAEGHLRAAADLREAAQGTVDVSGVAPPGGNMANETKNTARYVVAVESNVKRGVNAQLGQKTLIVGEWGSGKSAVVNSIELALSGRVSDMVGRAEVALAPELLSLAPGRKGPLTSRVRLSDGAEAKFELGAGRSKKATNELPASIDPDKVFPLRAVRDAVLGASDTARKFFLSLIAGAVSDADVLARVPKSLHPRYQKALLPAKVGMAPVDKLVIALDEAARLHREAKSKADGTATATTEAGQGLPPLPTEESITQAHEKLGAVKTKLEAAVAASTRAAQREEAQLNVEGQRVYVAQLKVELAEKESIVLRGGARLEELKAQLATVKAPPPMTAIQSAMALLITALGEDAASAEHLGADLGGCPVCGQDVAAALALRRAEAAKERIAQRNKDSIVRLEIETRIAKGTAVVAEAVGRVSVLHQEIARTEGFIAQVAGQEIPPHPTDLAPYRTDVELAEKTVRDLEAAKAAWANVQRTREASIEAKTEAEEWGHLVDECKNAVKMLLDGGIAGFVARVQAHLPPGFTFDLRLRDGDREVCQHGFVRDGVLHTALSGAEWAVEQAAIASAVCESWAKGKENPLFIVVPEDRGLSPRALDAVLAAFSNCPAQVIITTPTRPTFVHPGWTVIDADKGENHQPAVPPQPPAQTQLQIAGT